MEETRLPKESGEQHPVLVRLSDRLAEVEQRVLQLESQKKRLEEERQHLAADNERLRQRLGQYEPQVLREKRPGDGPPAVPPGATQYSLSAEEKRRSRRKKKKKSPGRRPNRLKFAQAERIEELRPAGVEQADCRLVRERAVWRLEGSRAVRVGYRIFRAAGHPEPKIPGVTPRCEYGLEILLVLAFLVYVIGISLDKAREVLQFFCQLPLSRSQADALLRQLGRHWEAEFDTLCLLLAQAAVVYMDETGWKVGQEGCSLWTLASDTIRVFLYACHKDDKTLDTLLPPEVFAGVGVSDDAAVYRRRFEWGQKCWAHLLRKAIQLTVLYPGKQKYRAFLDGLLALFYDAKRAAADKRLKETGRCARVAQFEERLCLLCQPYLNKSTDGVPPPERQFLNLVQELVERMMDEELFTFVLDPRVDATNNLSERLHRDAAHDREAGRTSQAPSGAKRRSVITSVMGSVAAVLPQFTLQTLLDEVQGWIDAGASRFTQQLEALGLELPSPQELRAKWAAIGIVMLAPDTG